MASAAANYVSVPEHGLRLAYWTCAEGARSGEVGAPSA